MFGVLQADKNESISAASIAAEEIFHMIDPWSGCT
jgi:hypothetical protein